MPAFRYEISHSSGAISAGVLNAPSLSAAAEQGRAQGHVIVALSPAGSPAAGVAHFTFTRPPAAREIANFTSQLAVMIRAGIPLRLAIEGISDQVENPRMRGMLVQLRKDVEAGKPFS